MLWINFLHFYQPVNTDAHIIKEATEMSYARVIRALEENPNIKFTININGSLLLRWEEMGYEDLIKRIARLIKRGQIDLTATACYHPLLPLIPKKEISKQIQENESILKKHFGDKFKANGFFLPEMAYSKDVAKIIKKQGYKWIILDEIAHNGKLKQVDTSQIYYDDSTKLKIIYRSRKYSSSFVPKTIKQKIEKDITIVSATDGELYGLRHIDHTAEFEKILKHKLLKTKTMSDFISCQKNIQKTNPINCSWDSSEEELKNNSPYVLWYDTNNKIQSKLWDLANLSYKTVEKYSKDDNHYWARWHLVRGLASCTFWWASDKDFSHIFGPHAWNPDEIERGMNEFIRSIRAIEDVASRKTKLQAEKLFIELKQIIWEKHWTSRWKA